MDTRRHALRERRQRLGITQAELAARIGISPITYYRIERGLRVPPLDVAYRIAAELQADLHDLFPRDTVA